MSKKEQHNLIASEFGTVLAFKAYLKSVKEEDLTEAAITLRIRESDISIRLKNINAELRRRRKKELARAGTQTS